MWRYLYAYLYVLSAWPYAVSTVIYICMKNLGQLQSLEGAVLNSVSISDTNCKFGEFIKPPLRSDNLLESLTESCYIHIYGLL